MSERPVLWIGGAGPPRGPLARELSTLEHPFVWAPLAQEAISKVAGTHPLLVIVETGRTTAEVRDLLTSLEEARRSLGFVVFLLAEAGQVRTGDPVDGVFVKRAGLAAQITAALSTLKASSTFDSGGDELRHELEGLRSELRRLSRLVVRDDLTCLYNLRFFDRSLRTEHVRAARFGRQYSLIFLDLDGLKEINTRHGHLAGAQVLRQLGDYLNRRLRSIDIPSRVGGDEFVVICPETSKPSARIVAERLRQGIEALDLHIEGNCRGITASLGVASFPEDAEEPDQVLERADQALYEAKARGKNSVCCWGDFPATESTKGILGSLHSRGVGGASDEAEEATPEDEAEST